MSREIVIVDGEPHEIETSPITLVYTGPRSTVIDYPRRIPLRPEDTLYHIERVQNLHDIFWVFWEYAHLEARMEGAPCAADADEIRKLGIGHKHLAGLLDLSLKFMDVKIPFVWKYPESYLHPALQASLGSVVILLDRRSKDLEEINRSLGEE